MEMALAGALMLLLESGPFAPGPVWLKLTMPR